MISLSFILKALFTNCYKAVSKDATKKTALATTRRKDLSSFQDQSPRTCVRVNPDCGVRIWTFTKKIFVGREETSKPRLHLRGQTTRSRWRSSVAVLTSVFPAVNTVQVSKEPELSKPGRRGIMLPISWNHIPFSFSDETRFIPGGVKRLKGLQWISFSAATSFFFYCKISDNLDFKQLSTG